MCETGARCDPVIAVARDEKIVDRSMRQSVTETVIYKFITVETRQAVAGAEPEIATRIGHDLVNVVARQTVGGRVSSDRKLFGAAVRKRDQDDENGDESLHTEA